MHLKEYLDENGIMKGWFAKKIGITSSYLVGFVNGKKPMATKYWTNIVLMTKGQVTLDDLLKMNNEYYEKKDKAKLEHSNSGQLSSQQKTKPF